MILFENWIELNCKNRRKKIVCECSRSSMCEYICSFHDLFIVFSSSLHLFVCQLAHTLVCMCMFFFFFIRFSCFATVVSRVFLTHCQIYTLHTFTHTSARVHVWCMYIVQALTHNQKFETYRKLARICSIHTRAHTPPKNERKNYMKMFNLS